MTDPTRTDPLAELRHELRTPINHILGYAEILLEDAAEGATAPFQPALREIHTAGKTLLERITEALAPTRTTVSDAVLRKLGADLLAPLERLLGFTDYLLERTNDPALHSFKSDVEKVHQGGIDLLTLIDRRLASALEGLQSGQIPRPADSGRYAAVVAARPARILVVDDNAANRDVLGRRLERFGYGVAYSADGEKALARVRAEPFDLVLLDIMMPGIDGVQVLETMKAAAELRDIPVVMISAVDDVANIVRCIERGAEDYLFKPFDPVLLRARVGACLEKKRLRDLELDYLRHVSAVTAAAAQVESGRFDPVALDAVAGRDDELGQLARVFGRMAQEVVAREARLRQQVQALTIEIDEARKAKQVAEITESDYFQTLQRRAESLRERKRR